MLPDIAPHVDPPDLVSRLASLLTASLLTVSAPFITLDSFYYFFTDLIKLTVQSV